MRDDNKWGYVRDADKLLDNIWDWREYANCFPRNIYPTDIDGMIEINNHFLFVETKLPHAPMPTGQRIALERLSQLPRVVVLIVYGKRNRPEQMQMIYNGKYGKLQPCTPDILAQRFRAFVAWANKSPF